ncbi:MAG: N-6 DNA methylase [Chloroflexota bacterium]|nr:N-6 DNA methylase [Chloroflexota bacterium]
MKSEPTPFEMVIKGLHDVPGGYGFYDFNAIDADVLGTIYEQYMGHRAQDPEGKQVVDRRAKRKARGIYYTPKFVVRYIVRQTLGRLLEERGYQQARQVKVLDPACGSGSFLIEALDVLDRYLAGVRGQNAASAAGDIHDFARRMEILTGNLYGVDLDAQAVEIARLNLLLKAVNQRGELPRLENIRQGNSLISGTPEELKAAFGPNWRDKHPFNWEEQFPRIMEQGGFDMIMGNPPYFNIETWGKHSPDAEWIKANFPETWMDKSDILFYFVTRGIQLLRGRLAFIVSRAFLEAAKAKRLREFILKRCAIETVIDFRNYQVFEDASIATAIIILRRETNAEIRQKAQIQVVQVRNWSDSGDALMARIESQIKTGEPYSGDDFCSFMYPQSQLDFQAWVFAPTELDEVWRRIDDEHPTLGEVCEIGKGMETGANKVFQVNEHMIEHNHLEKKWLRKRAVNSDVRRYHIEHSGGWLIYVEDVASFSECPPNIAEYLKMNRRRLEARAAYQRGNCEWFKFTWPLHKEWYTRSKLIVPYRAAENRFALDEATEYIGLTDTTNVFKRSDDQHDLKYYLGLLNSRLLTFRFRGIAKMTGSGMYEYFGDSVRQLPIRRINFDDPADVARHDRMVEMVEEMLRLQKEHAEAEALKEDRRHDLARHIERLDAEIDALVYELYGLTEEEIGVVEGQNH